MVSRRTERRQAKEGNFGQENSWQRHTQQREYHQGRAVLSRAYFHCHKDGHVTLNCPKNLATIHCVCCGSKGHSARFCESNRARGRENGACFCCGKSGHRKKDCTTDENDFEDVIEVEKTNVSENDAEGR